MRALSRALATALALGALLAASAAWAQPPAAVQRLAFLENLNLGDVQKIQKGAKSLVKVGKAAQRASAEITPEQEYYIGRAVAATIFTQYRPYQAGNINYYLNLLGQSLAAASDLPQTFGGYHFQVLESEEINAFAAPGGLILVARGLLRCAANEDELAAVLAHEIGHVQHKHGLAAIKQSRLLDLGGVLFSEGAKQFGSPEVKQLTQVFGQSVGDITKTLMVNGYSRDQERQADRAAVTILRRVGYQPTALVSMLIKMKARYPRGKVGFAKTHPDPLERVADIRSLIGPGQEHAPADRVQRFAKAMQGL